MKKVFQIIFVFVFTLITFGVTVNKHYSRGELFSIAIFSEPESCCEDVCNCCDEESETIQFLVDYTFSIDNFEPAPGEVVLFTFTLSTIGEEPELVLAKTEFVEKDLPPPERLISLSFFQNFLL